MFYEDLHVFVTALLKARLSEVFPIVVAHFARFSTSNLTALKLLTQENVLVGGFFVISGYVSAYTTTKLGALGVEDGYSIYI